MPMEFEFLDGDDSISERRRTEIDYHRKLNVRIALTGIPIFLFFAIYTFARGSLFQGALFSLMVINAASIVTMVSITSDMNQLMRLKQIGSAIAFGLLGISMVAAFFGEDFYIIFPYIFIYPIAVLLFFGERVGRYYAVTFCAATVSLVMFLDIPPWTAAHIKLFKVNTSMALIITVVVALISERTRVGMRDKLIAARHQAEAAETSQRQTNVELKKEIQRRTRSEEALSLSEKRYRALFEESSVTLWEEDWSQVKIYLDGLPQEAAEDLYGFLKDNPDETRQCVRRMKVLAVNRAALKLYEADTLAALTKNLRLIASPEFDVHTFMAERVVALYRKGRYETDAIIQSFGGRKLQVMITSTIPTGYEDSWEKVYTSVYDITEKIAMEEEKKRLDMQVQHTRHFQAIATLAGGIAHQFNNALGGIYGNLDLLEFKFSIEERSKRYINALRKSATRIARLTEQLLAYARGGKFQPRAISLNTIIGEMVETDISPQFPHVRTTLNLVPDLGETIGDETQIRAAVSAVLTNAMEAVAESGEVIVATRNQVIDSQSPGSGNDLENGRYVVTTVEDDGSGMDPQTVQQVFEPFFSTKFVGRGLGMSAAYGIIKNHGGAITVTSELGKGTRVTIFLPCVQPAAQPASRIVR